MYGLKAIAESGGLLAGEVDGMKLGYYAGKCEGGPRDGGSFSCCLPVDRREGGEYRHDAKRRVWVWEPAP